MCSEEEEFVYQLRHIGPPPSCKKVPNVMRHGGVFEPKVHDFDNKCREQIRLGFGVTKIGRGQNNDYFLDSIKLKNFISRYHAEVLGRKNENGKVEFVLTDKGLNGTFINDYRTQKTCPLEVGDKITFGHTNGYKIQPGFYASQPDSEFQFIFEQVPKSSRTSELSTDNFNREESTEATQDQKKYSERTFLSDKHSNIQSPQITSTKDLQRNSDSENEENQEIDTSADVSKTDTYGKGSSKTSHAKDKKSLDTSQDSVTSKSVKSGKDKNVSALAETLPAVNDDDNDEKDDSDDDNKDGKGSDDDDFNKDGKGSDDENNKNDEKNVDDSDEEDKSEADKSEEEKKEKESDSSSEEEEIKPKKTVKKKKRTTRSIFTKPKPKPKAKEPKEDVVSFSDESSEDDVQKQVSSVLALINTTSESDSGQPAKKEEPPKPPPRGQRSRRKSGLSNSTSTANKGGTSRKRNHSGQKTTANSKKRKTTAVRGKKDTKADDPNLSDGVEWYEEDTCESADCKRPKNKKTPWVQCDDCDGWYHTVCVGANYRQVKDDNASFSCGCT